MEAQRSATEYEIRELSAKPRIILPEILHGIAYDGKGLGNPLLCPEECIDLIDALLMRHFLQQMYRPERMVIASAGLTHEELVELADKHFSSTFSFSRSPRLAAKAFWGGSSTFGGVTPVHTNTIPDLLAGAAIKSPALQENIDPSLNTNGAVNSVGLSTLGAAGKPAPFDAFADLNPFTMKVLDAYVSPGSAFPVW